MGGIQSVLSSQPEFMGPGVQMFSDFSISWKNHKRWRDITTEFLESARLHHAAERNLAYRCATKSGDASITSTVEMYADAAGVAVHSEHVKGVMQKVQDDNVLIPFAVVAAPESEVESLKFLDIPVYTFLDGAFTRTKAVDGDQFFVHIVSEWTMKNKSATEEAILAQAGGTRDRDDPEFEGGQLFFGGAVNGSSLVISEAYMTPHAVKMHLDRVKKMRPRFTHTCRGNWSRLYCSMDQLPALTQMLADGWFRGNGFYKSPEFFVVDDRSFALRM